MVGTGAKLSSHHGTAAPIYPFKVEDCILRNFNIAQDEFIRLSVLGILAVLLAECKGVGIDANSSRLLSVVNFVLLLNKSPPLVRCSATRLIRTCLT